MIPVVTPEKMRAVDRHLIDVQGIPGLTLMENAAQGLLAVVREANAAHPGPALVLCGPGNNGGDGLALLRLLRGENIPAYGLLLGAPERLSGDAAANYRRALEAGCGAEYIQDAAQLELVFQEKWGVIVDALFGTGLARPVEGLARAALEWANAARAYRIAADIPSGVHGGTGEVPGIAFRADETITFQAAKRGQLLYPGREHAGKLTVWPIGDLDPAYDIGREVVLEKEDVAALLPPRAKDSHKGDHGRGLLVAGSLGYMGAASMSAAAALRAGCGLLTVATPGNLIPMLAGVREAMTCPLSDGDALDETSRQRLEERFPQATAVAVGPGLGTSPAARALVEAVLLSGKPAVLDADGLNLLASDPALLKLLHPNLILTPHPGEMARLTGRSIHDISVRPVEAATEFAASHNCVLLLKGATSVIAAPDGAITYNLAGNPGLAKGGSGDVLTGILLALLCQGLAPYDAARAGAYLLGLSADMALELLRERALIAGDVIGAIRCTLEALDGKC